MNPRLLSLIVGAGLAAGCAGISEHLGAADSDGNVLTGGPLSGTTLSDLPQPVIDHLQQQMPAAEIADIDKITRNSQVVYQISFTRPKEYPSIELDSNGDPVPTPVRADKPAENPVSISQSE